jgi:hypothetical protein
MGKNWSISDYKERQLTTIDGKEYLNQTSKMYYNSTDSAGTNNTLKIPNTKDGKEYSIESMAPEQKHVVLAIKHTIIKFLKNNKAYVPIHATIMGCGGTGKSYIIDTILTIIKNIAGSNATSLIGTSSGAATFNVQDQCCIISLV